VRVRIGVPHEIASDRGREYVRFVREVYAKLVASIQQIADAERLKVNGAQSFGFS
jgi:ABC-type proline/glycine betaine transport system ATPase subunit